MTPSFSFLNSVVHIDMIRVVVSFTPPKPPKIVGTSILKVEIKIYFSLVFLTLSSWNSSCWNSIIEAVHPSWTAGSSQCWWTIVNIHLVTALLKILAFPLVPKPYPAYKHYSTLYPSLHLSFHISYLQGEGCDSHMIHYSHPYLNIIRALIQQVQDRYYGHVRFLWPHIQDFCI